MTQTQIEPEVLIKLLDKIGVEVESETSNELICYCPFHMNRSTPAFNMSIEPPYPYRCWNTSCGESGTLMKLLQKCGNMTIYEAMREIYRARNNNVSLRDILERATHEEEPYEIWPEEMLDKVKVDYDNPEELKKISSVVDKQGFSLDTVKYFNLGYSKKKNRVVIPVRNEEGELVGFSGRAISPEDEEISKYWDKGLPKRDILYNLNNAKKYATVIIVEGPFDAMKIHQAGFPNVVALMGGGLAKGQAKKLTHYFREAIIYTDNDDAGRKMSEKIQEVMRKAGRAVAYIKYPKGKKDPGECTEDEIRQAIESKESLLQRKLREMIKGE